MIGKYLPTAHNPCSALTAILFPPSDVASFIGARNRPCSKFSRYTSQEPPTTIKSPVCRTYVMSRPCRGVRVV